MQLKARRETTGWRVESLDIVHYVWAYVTAPAVPSSSSGSPAT